MGEYSGSLNLNSRRKPVDQFKDGQLKGGIKREQLDDKFKPIFDALNKDGNDVLDAEEMNDFWGKLVTFAKDDTLGGREAAKLLKDLNLKDLKKEDLYEFVASLGLVSENIKESKVERDEEGNRTFETEYADGKQEIIHDDGSSQVTTTDEDGAITTEYLDKDKKLTQKYYFDKTNDYSETTWYESDANGESIPSSATIKDKGKSSEVIYENGKPVSETVTRTDDIVMQYEYIDDEPRLVSKKNPNGNETFYTYNEDGTVTATCETDEYKLVLQLASDAETPLSSEMTTPREKIVTTYKDGKIVKTNKTNLSNNSETITEYNSDSMRIKETKTFAEKETNEIIYRSADFDGQGNIYAVVQFSVKTGTEKAEHIAKVYGCTVEEFYAANPELQNGKVPLKPGQIVKVPYTGELEPEIVNRKKKEYVDSNVSQYNETVAYNQWVREHNANLWRNCREEAKSREKFVVEDFALPRWDIRDSNKKMRSYDLDSVSGLALYLYRLEGLDHTQICREQLQVRKEQLIKYNPGKFDKDGKLKNKDYFYHLNLPVNEVLYAKFTGQKTRAANAEAAREISLDYSDGFTLAKDAYASIAGKGTDEEKLARTIGKVNKKNVVGFLDGYKKNPANVTNYGGESFVKALYGDVDSKTAKSYLDKLADALEAHAEGIGLNYSDKIGKIKKSYDKSEIERLFDEILAGIQGRESLPKSEWGKTDEKLTTNDVDGFMQTGRADTSNANALLRQILENEGFFGDCWIGIKRLAGTEEIPETTKADIKRFEKKLDYIKLAYDTSGIDGFKMAYKQEFGCECDINLLKTYMALNNRLASAQALPKLEKHFKGFEFWTDKKQFIEKLKTFEGFEKIDFSKYSVDDLKKIITEQLNQYRLQGAVNIEEIETRIQEITPKLFGKDGGAVARVQKFAANQQEGAGYLKMGVKLVTAILAGATTSGAGAAAVWTAGTSLAFDVGDAFYRQGVNGGEPLSAIEFLDYFNEAAVNGALVFLGANTAKSLHSGLTAKGLLAKGATLTKMLAADVGLGVVGEYVLEGKVTIQGVTFSAFFSVAGNLIALKQLSKAKAKEMKAPKTQLEIITNNGELPHVGRLNDDKFALVQRQTSEYIPNATNEELLAMRRQASSLAPEQGNLIINQLDNELMLRQISTETNLGNLHEMESQVSGWKDNARNRDGILQAIAERQAELKQTGSYEIQSRQVTPEIKEKAMLALSNAKRHLMPDQIDVIREYIMSITEPTELSVVVSNLQRRMKLNGGKLRQAIDIKYAELNLPNPLKGEAVLPSQSHEPHHGELDEVVRQGQEQVDVEIPSRTEEPVAADKTPEVKPEPETPQTTRETTVEPAAEPVVHEQKIEPETVSQPETPAEPATVDKAPEVKSETFASKSEEVPGESAASSSTDANKGYALWESNKPNEKLPKHLKNNSFVFYNKEQLLSLVDKAVKNGKLNHGLTDQFIEVLEYRGMTGEIERLGKVNIVHSSNNALRAIAGHEPVARPNFFSRLFGKKSPDGVAPKSEKPAKPEKVSKKEQKRAEAQRTAEREAQYKKEKEFQAGFKSCDDAGETFVSHLEQEDIGITVTDINGWRSVETGNMEVVDLRSSFNIKDSNVQRLYNAEADVIVIGIPGSNGGRSDGSVFTVQVKGRVSQADAEVLIAHLRAKGNPLSYENSGLHPLFNHWDKGCHLNAKKVQECVAEFFNNRSNTSDAFELDALFDRSGLRASGHVANEAQVGESGFVSYRHEGESRTSTNYKPEGVEDPYLKAKAEKDIVVEDIEPDTPVLTGKWKNIAKQIENATNTSQLTQLENTLATMLDCPEKTFLQEKIQTKKPN